MFVSVCVHVFVCMSPWCPELWTINGVSELYRRLARLKVTVCLGLLWLRPNHDVAPGNRMSPWHTANLRNCASPVSHQELRNCYEGSHSPPFTVSFSCFPPCLSLFPNSLNMALSSQWVANIFQICSPLLPSVQKKNLHLNKRFSLMQSIKIFFLKCDLKNWQCDEIVPLVSNALHFQDFFFWEQD